MPGASRYLLPGESILASTRKHPAALLGAAGVWLLGLLAASVISLLLAGRTPPPIPRIASSVIAFAFTIKAMLQWAAWFTDTYMITDGRVLRKWGIFSLKVSSIQLSPGTQVTLSRPIWGRLFKYGSLTLEPSGASGRSEKLTFLPRPVEHYRLIAALVTERRATRDTGTGRWNGRIDPQEEDTGPLPPVVV